MLPREKLKQRGIRTLSDAELIAVMLGVGTKGRDVVKLGGDIARFLSSKCKPQLNDDWFSEIHLKDLKGFEGMGEVKSLKIISALELGRRLFSPSCRRNITLRSRRDVIKQMSYLKSLKQEHVVVLLLDARNSLIDKITVAVGSLNKAVVEPRDIFFNAISCSSSKIILVHNHPSGDTAPSKADIHFEEKMQKAGKLLGIEVLDQVIV
jgi:DNA repair protein RadC